MRQKFSTRCSLSAVLAAMLVLAAPAEGADELVLKDQVVDRYTVQKGDTLWGISGKFLKEPWRWPEIWRMNREQIKNPHWIYPGDVIVLDRTDGRPRLSMAPAIRLSPTVRVAPLESEAIPSVPSGDIEPYLTWPLVTGAAGLADAAEIVAGRDQQREIRGDGDVVYATGLDPKAGTSWRLYRPAAMLTSPDTGEVLGYEQQYLGNARVERFDVVSTVRIVNAREEIQVGDRLLPAPPEQLVSYAPHPPDRPVNAKIIQTNRDAAEVGRGWVVTLDKGTADGIDVGTVLAVYKGVPHIRDPRQSNARDILDPTKLSQEDHFLEIPDERVGLVFVFRVFDRVSYALVLNTTDPVVVGDYLRKP